MKKSIIVLSSILVLGLATGCGGSKKVLECTKTETESGMEMKGTEKITFNGDTVEDYKAEFNVTLEEEYKEYKSTFISVFEAQFKEYDDLDGVTVDTKETDDGIKVTITADVPKMKEDDLKTLDLAKKASYSETKKDRVNDGYKCK